MLDSSTSSEEQESQDDDYEDETRNDTPEEDSQTSEHENNESRRGPGCPKILRTGKPGRPRKIYQSSDAQRSDPKSTSQMLKRDDKEK